MPEPAPPTAELRRTPLARLRTGGFLGVVSWFVLALGGAAIVGGDVDGDAFVLLLFVATVIGRLAVATEYLRCDADGLVWRSVLVTHHVPWERVAAIETALVRNERWRGRMTFPVASMVVVLPNGVQQTLTPSIWCPIMSHAEFVAAARLISPVDWADIEDATVAVVRPGRGRRVGRPIPRRRRGTGA